jgi:hypothetical protein
MPFFDYFPPLHNIFILYFLCPGITLRQTHSSPMYCMQSPMYKTLTTRIWESMTCKRKTVLQEFKLSAILICFSLVIVHSHAYSVMTYLCPLQNTIFWCIFLAYSVIRYLCRCNTLFFGASYYRTQIYVFITHLPYSLFSF